MATDPMMHSDSIFDHPSGDVDFGSVFILPIRAFRWNIALSQMLDPEGQVSQFGPSARLVRFIHEQSICQSRL